ncbi:hypothetical protein D3C76_643160 [compost metagenome]
MNVHQHAWVSAVERMQPRQQPFRAEGWQGSQAQGAYPRLIGQCLQGGAADAPQCLAELALVQAADIGQLHLAPLAAEQGQAQLLLQGLHLAADRALGQRQFGGGTGVAFMPGGGLESQQQ